MKRYDIAFSGSKRNRLKEIVEIVKAGGYDAVYEPFGGSCIISTNLKVNGYVKRAVANDYDKFIAKLQERVNTYKKIQTWLDKNEYTPDSRRKLPVDKIVKLEEFIKTLNSDEQKYSSLCCVFSARRAAGNVKPIDFKYYFRRFPIDRTIEYKRATENIETPSLDWRDFMRKYSKDMRKEKVLIIVDPPYLNSYQKQYGCEHFGLAETIDLLQEVIATGSNFLFFNQIEKDISRLLDIMGVKYSVLNKYQTLTKGVERIDSLFYVRGS